MLGAAAGRGGLHQLSVVRQGFGQDLQHGLIVRCTHNHSRYTHNHSRYTGGQERSVILEYSRCTVQLKHKQPAGQTDTQTHTPPTFEVSVVRHGRAGSGALLEEGRQAAGGGDLEIRVLLAGSELDNE